MGGSTPRYLVREGRPLDLTFTQRTTAVYSMGEFIPSRSSNFVPTDSIFRSPQRWWNSAPTVAAPGPLPWGPLRAVLDGGGGGKEGPSSGMHRAKSRRRAPPPVHLVASRRRARPHAVPPRGRCQRRPLPAIDPPPRCRRPRLPAPRRPLPRLCFTPAPCCRWVLLPWGGAAAAGPRRVDRGAAGRGGRHVGASPRPRPAPPRPALPLPVPSPRRQRRRTRAFPVTRRWGGRGGGGGGCVGLVVRRTRRYC